MKKKLKTVSITLKPDFPKTKKHIYALKSKAGERRRALDESITLKSKLSKYSYSKRKAALAKKRRLGVLRLYRRYKYPKQCRKITYDMRYIDKTYLGKKANTNHIC